MTRMLSSAITGAICSMYLVYSGPAEACTTNDPEQGLRIYHPFPKTMPQGGVLAITASVLGATVDTAMADLTEFRVTHDDVEVPGALEVVTLSSATGPSALQYHELILVWRPQQPLVVGDALVLHYTHRPDEFEPHTVPFIVDDAPTTITLPGLRAIGSAVEVDESAWVCCEVLADSCNTTTRCLPTRVQRVAGVTLPDARLAGDWPQGYLWAARVDAQGEVGPRLPRVHDPYPLAPHEPSWAAWPDPIVFTRDDAAPYCVVLGATSLVDGTSLVSGPLCVTAEQVGELGELELEADFSAQTSDVIRECVSDPVYEADGSPYPPREASGCRTTPNPGSLAMLLLGLGLLSTRRIRRT